MTRYLLALVVAFSLALTGVANAMSAFDCPYLKTPAAHDCCPPTGEDHQDKTGDRTKSLDCKIGQACRTVPVVAPVTPVLAQISVAVIVAPIILHEDAGRPSPLFAHWKPPRSA